MQKNSVRFSTNQVHEKDLMSKIAENFTTKFKLKSTRNKKGSAGQTMRILFLIPFYYAASCRILAISLASH